MTSAAQLAPLDTPAVLSEEQARKCWGTPPGLFAALHREYGFTVDACANESNAKLPRYWTPEDDGLRQPWAGEVIWCNPPYDNIEPWVARAYYETRRECRAAVLLVPARTDQRWWHTYAMQSVISFVVGRVSFVPPAGIRESSNREPSAVLQFHTFDGGRIAASITPHGQRVNVLPPYEQLTLGAQPC